MKLTKTSIAVIAVTGLLALTSAVRAQTNASTNAAPPPKGGRGPSVEAQLDRIDKAVTLTDAQKPKVKAVLEDQSKQMQGLRDLAPEDRRAKAQALREEMNKKIKEILTPEQYAKYEAMPPMGRGGKKGGGGGNAGGGGGEPKQ
jgi:Spy/CpxP family protein refolding chaperone